GMGVAATVVVGGGTSGVREVIELLVLALYEAK
ncbi:hypothetical protein A2U01_0114012, partial [Trifolium medium]|nr:hypothetical protein [Trifolium medium]